MSIYWKLFFRYLKLRLLAIRWLRGNGPVKIAAFCMFHLNRLARAHEGKRHTVYAVKSAFIRWLYESGYCTAVTLQKQTMECWSCHGTGEYYTGAICWKCDGSGVYRTHLLYRFVFDVDGRSYVWHQPKSLVDWPVRVNFAPIGKYDERGGRNGEWLDTAVSELYLVTVHEFLRQRGTAVELAALPGLRETLVWQWRAIRNKVRWWKGQAKRRLEILRRLWLYIETGEMPPLPEDEIPF